MFPQLLGHNTIRWSSLFYSFERVLKAKCVTDRLRNSNLPMAAVLEFGRGFEYCGTFEMCEKSYVLLQRIMQDLAKSQSNCISIGFGSFFGLDQFKFEIQNDWLKVSNFQVYKKLVEYSLTETNNGTMNKLLAALFHSLMFYIFGKQPFDNTNNLKNCISPAIKFVYSVGEWSDESQESFHL